jgi:glutamate formiminotransferase/formiminotetrahydrofolate cyclodeaminase
VGAELAVPVYLYERAATSSGRVNLAHVRKGNFEGLRDLIGREEARAPDFGPNRIHPTFGAIAIGARPVLVAYNIYLGNESALPVARRIASGVRETGGGLPAVKAMGLLVDGQAQVSMNLVDIDRTPVHVAFDAVRRAAEGEGLSVTWSEIVGLVPERALVSAGIANLRLDRFNTSQILEKRVHEALHDEPTVSDFLGQVASASPVPGGGTAAAHSASLAAALVEMVAAVTQGRKKFAPVESEMRTIVASATELRATLSALARADSDAYSAVAAAYKLPRNTDKEFRSRGAAIDAALLQAARVPLDTARQAVHVARLALKVTERGNPNALSDGGVAALLAQAAVRGASYNVRVNVASLSDPREGLSLAAESVELTREVEQLAERVREVVERAIALG